MGGDVLVDLRNVSQGTASKICFEPTWRDGIGSDLAWAEFLRQEPRKHFDGAFDAAVRDPSSPTKLQPQFNPGDNLHLTDAGYQAMANAIDLGLFKKR